MSHTHRHPWERVIPKEKWTNVWTGTSQKKISKQPRRMRKGTQRAIQEVQVSSPTNLHGKGWNEKDGQGADADTWKGHTLWWDGNLSQVLRKALWLYMWELDRCIPYGPTVVFSFSWLPTKHTHVQKFHSTLIYRILHLKTKLSLHDRTGNLPYSNAKE